MTTWADGYWWSNDGVRLHYRDYPGDAARPPIICLPGLTRNARDFHEIASDLSSAGWRVIAVDLRGRGESGYAKDPLSYTPLTYLQDVEALVAELALPRFVLFGTSLGGILTMLLSATGAERIAGALLNDIGPALMPGGLARIRTYVGKSSSYPTWLHAARAVAEVQAVAHPKWDIEQWLAQAKRLCRLTPAGRIVFDYDMKIAEPFRLPGGEAGVDLWPAFDSLKGTPVLLVRGALTDLLSSDTVREMERRLPQMETVEVPDAGHTPTLDEPMVREAIARLLERVEAR
ncbi:alpha/beta fold hydrolase [Sphingomonas jatrophae]|uniref:Lysophospholipase, alpha-beta hydrolase superfamily n=1 Tax=Sphingomonas jatrophae TaxID=1166337 RepID=A0A1I6JTW6_9SPHN|nr:alpha/beta hydrolase [Sphingomonas jatrophae]SFR82393.1 Lysophospholipase, alpha-beta hydrolase superfamily [Sphingomonas jatrophae]